MSILVDLDLTKYHDQLRFSESEGHPSIWDPVRKAYFKIAPEEIVRQSWLLYLHHDYKQSYASMSVEKQLIVSGLKRRFDLVLYKKSQPFILFEFKAPEQSLTSDVGLQVAQYNQVLKVPYIVISNGISSYCFHVDAEKKEVGAVEALPL